MSARGRPDLAYWRSSGGELWARHNDFTERLFAPVTAALLAAMLVLARRLAPPEARTEFVEADAVTCAVASASFDQLVSRHGVMFFDDPVRAFANLRSGLKSRGRLAFSCFRSPRDNAWAMIPLQAISRFVPPLPKLAPDDPGPFSFADEARVQRILGAAGFIDVALEPIDVKFDIATGRGLDAAVANALEIGPTSRAIEGQPPDVVAKVAAALHEALAPYTKGDHVELPAAIWIVTARKP